MPQLAQALPGIGPRQLVVVPGAGRSAWPARPELRRNLARQLIAREDKALSVRQGSPNDAGIGPVTFGAAYRTARANWPKLAPIPAGIRPVSEL